MKIRFLSEKFYNEYGKFEEILKKQDRPYLVVLIECDGNQYALPFRTNINHRWSFICSDEIGYRGGLDFTKAIPVLDEKYIREDENIKIKQSEFNYLKGKEESLKKEFKKYLREYKKAQKNREQERYKNILKFSVLKYFEE